MIASFVVAALVPAATEIGGTVTEEEVVDGFYAAVFARDVDGALAHCSDDAMYHPLVSPTVALPGWRWGEGSLPIRTYVAEVLPEFLDDASDSYGITSMDRDVHDGLVVSRLRTTLGSGVMVFRVERGKLTDVWVMSAKGRAPDAAF